MAGFDGVPYEILKLAKNALSALLTNLFNTMFDISYVPAVWAKGIICSIFKSGIKNNPGNYHGISVLSCISKIFTEIIHKKIVNWTEKRKPFRYSQAGFREGKVLLTTTCAACPSGKISIKEEREILLMFCRFSKSL